MKGAAILALAILAGCAPPVIQEGQLAQRVDARPNPNIWRAECRFDQIDRAERCDIAAPRDWDNFLSLRVGPDGSAFFVGRARYPEIYRARIFPSGGIVEGRCDVPAGGCVTPPGTLARWRGDLLSGGELVVQLDGRSDAATMRGTGLAAAIAEAERRDPRWTAPPPAPPARRGRT